MSNLLELMQVSHELGLFEAEHRNEVRATLALVCDGQQEMLVLDDYFTYVEPYKEAREDFNLYLHYYAALRQITAAVITRHVVMKSVATGQIEGTCIVTMGEGIGEKLKQRTMIEVISPTIVRIGERGQPQPARSGDKFGLIDGLVRNDADYASVRSMIEDEETDVSFFESRVREMFSKLRSDVVSAKEMNA